MKIDGPHLVEVQVHMEHVVEKGKKEEMTTHWSEHKVKESNIDEVVASTKSTALKMAYAFRMTQKKYADLEKAGSALCEFCKAVRQENCNSCTLHEVLDSAWMEAAAEGVIDNWRITRKQDLSKKEMRIKFGMTKKKHAEIKKASSVLCKFCKAVPEKDCCGCIVQELLDSAWIETAAEEIFEK